MPAFNSFQNKEIRLVYCILTRQTQEEMKIVWYSNQIQSSFYNPKTQKKFLTIWKPSISILYFNILVFKKNIFHSVSLSYILFCYLIQFTIFQVPSLLHTLVATPLHPQPHSHISSSFLCTKLTHFLPSNQHRSHLAEDKIQYYIHTTTHNKY